MKINGVHSYLSYLGLLVWVGRLTTTTTNAYLLPGLKPTTYERDDIVPLFVNKMTSVHSLLDIEYYRLPFCRPNGPVKRQNENLGELLAGDKFENSPYVLKFRKDMNCEQLCTSNLGRTQKGGGKPSKMVKMIHWEYHNNWIVDNLPAARFVRISDTEDQNIKQFFRGFPIGFVDEKSGTAYIYNHVNIVISYAVSKQESNKYHIVRFVVDPLSIDHGELDVKDESYDKALPNVAVIKKPIESCALHSKKHTTRQMVEGKPQEASGNVLFTYDVIWTLDEETTWATRWDIYLTMNKAIPARVHWLNVVNSMIIVLVLTAMIAAILVRNLQRDLQRYNRVPTDEESRAEELEEFGWKLVHADVFRPPSMPMFLAVMVGTGAQLLCMSFLVTVIAATGSLNPSHRGRLLMVELIAFVLLGGVNGYITARLYKTFKGKSWQRATMCTAFGFPGIAFGLFLLMNFIALVKRSKDAVPFTTILVLFVLWFGISAPLVFLGAYLGYGQDPIEFPVNTSSIPRQIPDQPWFMGVPFTLAIGGILPFGSCFVELYFIFASVWADYYYYVFGILVVVFIILVITCAEITVLFTYFQLCSEDYHWWWRSYCNGGSMAIYVFLYSIWNFKKLEANTVASYFLYFGYTGLISAGLFAMMGCVGVLSSLWFNKVIFASIKID